jgi:hypothetical protein
MRDQIIGRIRNLGEGRVFSAKDFLDIASRGTIDMTFASLSAGGDDSPHPARTLRPSESE